MIDYEWLETCVNAGEFLYGYFTAETLKSMYERKEGCRASVPELTDAVETLEEEGNIFVTYVPGQLGDRDRMSRGFYGPVPCEGTELESVMRQADKNGNPYASLHYDDAEWTDLLADMPEDMDFYIPTEQEIVQLVSEGYIRTPAMTELERRIRENGADPAYLKELWSRISTDKLDAMEAIQAVLKGSGMKFREGSAFLDDANAFLKYVIDFLNHVNLRARRGWRPADLSRKDHPNGLTRMPTIMPGSVHAARMLREAEPALKAMGAEVDYSSIDSVPVGGIYGEKRVVKVGRNDPCPCGSGLKYKRCHGRGR